MVKVGVSLAVLVLAAVLATALDPSGWTVVKNGQTRFDACIAAGGDTWNFLGSFIDFPDPSVLYDTYIPNLSACLKKVISARALVNAISSAGAIANARIKGAALACCSSSGCAVPPDFTSYLLPPVPAGAWRVSFFSVSDTTGPLLLEAFIPHIPDCLASFTNPECTASGTQVNSYVPPEYVLSTNQAIYITDTTPGHTFQIFSSVIYDFTKSYADYYALLSITDPSGHITYIKLSDAIANGQTVRAADATNLVWNIGTITIQAGGGGTFTPVNVFCDNPPSAAPGSGCTPP